MNWLGHKYIRILKIELEDLSMHIDALVRLNQERRTRREETEHVCFENITVLLNEKCGIEEFLAVMDEIDPDHYEDLDEMIREICCRFREKVVRCAIAPATYIFTERKIHKVREYVCHKEPHTSMAGAA